MSKIKKWHIYLANLDPVIGSEQGKTRPVLVISENEINDIYVHDKSLIKVVIT
jgi:mRNA-degrading endonuclease toxin of MazEF toxin-antitoxin module